MNIHIFCCWKHENLNFIWCIIPTVWGFYRIYFQHEKKIFFQFWSTSGSRGCGQEVWHLCLFSTVVSHWQEPMESSNLLRIMIKFLTIFDDIWPAGSQLSNPCPGFLKILFTGETVFDDVWPVDSWISNPGPKDTIQKRKLIEWKTKFYLIIEDCCWGNNTNDTRIQSMWLGLEVYLTTSKPKVKVSTLRHILLTAWDHGQNPPCENIRLSKYVTYVNLNILPALWICLSFKQHNTGNILKTVLNKIDSNHLEKVAIFIVL